MQLTPYYIDVSDLVLTECQNWRQISRIVPVKTVQQDSESNFSYTLSPGSQPISYYDFPNGCLQSFQNCNYDQNQSQWSAYSFQESWDHYSWTEELNEYGDVINKQLVQRRESKYKNEVDETTQLDSASQKNEAAQELDRFSEKNIIPEQQVENYHKGSSQIWWDEPRKYKIERYLKKKERRFLGKKFSYNCRKTVANIRLRIKGKFIGRSQAQKILNEGLNQMSNDEIKERLLKYYQDS